MTVEITGRRGFSGGMSDAPLNALIAETFACLTRAVAGREPAEAMLRAADPCRAVRARDVTPALPAHAGLLDRAIACMEPPQFAPLQRALQAARDHLHWRVDDGGFYGAGADVGDGYRRGNMHTLLIGPRHAPIHAPDLLMGFFLLAPHTLYRDHAHAAPELYLTLTGPSGWRFDQGAWEDRPAGSVICNAPERVHATRVDDVPFLAVFLWTRDIASPCRVVERPDWSGIEAALQAQRES